MSPADELRPALLTARGSAKTFRRGSRDLDRTLPRASLGLRVGGNSLRRRLGGTCQELRKEVSERRAERASGLDKQQWQHASGPYLKRMLATGHYPRLAESVQGARHLTASEVFELGLDYLVKGMEAH